MTVERTLFVNGRFYSKSAFTGTQRSSHNLLSSLAAALPAIAFQVFVADGNPLWKQLPQRGRIQLKLIFTRFTLLLHAWEQFVFPWASRKRLCLNCVGTAPFLFGTRRQIMVVHDINYLLLPSIFSLPYRIWAWFVKKLAAKRARKIICFSEYVKQTLVERLRIEPERIAVIYQGPGLDASLLYPAQEIEKKEPYFLCVGGLQPHKNLRRVLEAWKQAHAAQPALRLKIVGAPQRNFRSCRIASESWSSMNVEFMGYLADAQLAELYRHATGLIYPSLEEGFGLPLVEAFYLGCPVITSNTSCLPEIAGPAALLVNPYCSDSIRAAILRLFLEPETRRRLIHEGLLRRNLFSWEAAGRRLVAELESLFALPA